MIHYSIQPRDQIFLKGYGSLSFARNMSKNISKNISSKYSQKFLDYPKQHITNALKTASKRVIQKTAEATGDLIGNKIADKNTRVSKTLTQNNSVTNEEMLREKHISLEERQLLI